MPQEVKTFSTYTYRMLKKLDKDTGISKKGMNVLDSFLFDMIERIGEEAGRAAAKENASTLRQSDCKTALRLLFPGELAKHATSEFVRAVTKYEDGLTKHQKDKTKDKKKKTQEQLAGLDMSVSRVYRLLKQSSSRKRLSKLSAVGVAAAVQYLIEEILEVSIKLARDHKKMRIVPHYIMLAVRKDAELDMLLKDVVIAQGGVQEKIHHVLLPKV